MAESSIASVGGGATMNEKIMLRRKLQELLENGRNPSKQVLMQLECETRKQLHTLVGFAHGVPIPVEVTALLTIVDDPGRYAAMAAQAEAPAPAPASAPAPAPAQTAALVRPTAATPATPLVPLTAARI